MLLKKTTEKFSKIDYVAGRFQPYINFATAIKPCFYRSHILFRNNKHIMTGLFGKQDFCYNGHELVRGWVFEYQDTVVVFFCSKRGSSLEIKFCEGCTHAQKQILIGKILDDLQQLIVKASYPSTLADGLCFFKEGIYRLNKVDSQWVLVNSNKEVVTKLSCVNDIKEASFLPM